MRKWSLSQCASATADLVERIGEIYDAARARAIRESLDMGREAEGSHEQS